MMPTQAPPKADSQLLIEWGTARTKAVEPPALGSPFQDAAGWPSLGRQGTTFQRIFLPSQGTKVDSDNGAWGPSRFLCE